MEKYFTNETKRLMVLTALRAVYSEIELVMDVEAATDMEIDDAWHGDYTALSVALCGGYGSRYKDERCEETLVRILDCARSAIGDVTGGGN